MMRDVSRSQATMRMSREVVGASRQLYGYLTGHTVFRHILKKLGNRMIATRKSYDIRAYC